MPTNLGTGDRIARTATRTVTRTVDEQFLTLICSDEDLLRAEFDAIIAAEWPGPPTNNRAADPPTAALPAMPPAAASIAVQDRWPDHNTPAPADGLGNAHPRPRQPRPTTEERQVTATRESAITR
jgi:hypothetical protein